MTTIAYRAGVMAGDSCWSYGDEIMTMQSKVLRTEHNVLLGVAGGCSDREVLKMLAALKSPDDFPTLLAIAELVGVESSFSYLIAFPQENSLYLLDIGANHNVELIHLQGEYVAIGSGSKAAMTAMDLGNTAPEAVAAACIRDLNSREPVTFVAHERAPATKSRSRRKAPVSKKRATARK